MRSSPLRLAGLALLATGLTGFTIPIPLPGHQVEAHTTTSTTPLVRPVQTTTRVNYKKCEWFMLGWIPLTQDVTLAGIVSELSAGSDGMVDVSVESHSYNAILVAAQCWRVAGTPFEWIEVPVVPIVADGNTPPENTGGPQPDPQEAAVEDQAPPEQTTPVVMADLSAPPPPKAEPLTARLLSQLGLAKPTDADAYRALVAEVWNLRQKNKLADRDMVQRARLGASKVAPGSDLMTVLHAGAADPSGD